MPGIYHFEACEAERVVYQLDYNKEGRRDKQEYVQMFEDCGWEYLTDFAGYSYFRKPESEMSGTEEIFCDDDSRSEMLKRIFMGRMIPLLVIFFAILVPGLVRSLQHTQQASEWAVLLIFAIFLFVYIGIFIKFASSYLKLKRRMGR